MLPYSKEELIRQYFSLSQAQQKDQREYANAYILNFLEHAECWQISRELILDQQQNNYQELAFIGANLLYKKTKWYFAVLKSEQLLELRGFCFQLLNTRTVGRATLKQVCATLGVVALLTVTTPAWDSMVDDIIQYMRQEGTENVEFGLEIFEALARDLPELNLDEKTRCKIRRAVLAQSDRIFELFNTLFTALPESAQLTPERRDLLLEKALDCLSEWCDSGLKLLLFSDANLTNSLIKLLDFDLTHHFSKVADIFDRAFTYADGSGLLEARSLFPNKNIEAPELANLANIVRLLLVLGEQHFQVAQRANIDFCQTYAHLLTKFVAKYDIFLLEGNAQGLALLNLLLIVLRHPALSVAIIPMDELCTLRQQLKEYLPQQPLYQHLLAFYLEVFKVTLERSKYPAADLALKLGEQPNAAGPSQTLALSDLRDTSRDLILHCFLVVKLGGAPRVLEFFQLVYTCLTHIQDLTVVEVGIFAVHSVLDDALFFEKSNEYISSVLEAILAPDFPQNNDFLTHEALLLIESSFFVHRESAQLRERTLRYLLHHALNSPQLSSLASSGFRAICNAIEQHEMLETLNLSVQCLERILSSVNSELVVENIVQGVFTLALKLSEQSTRNAAFENLLALLQRHLDQLIQSSNAQNSQLALTAIHALTSIFHGFDVHDQPRVLLLQRTLSAFASNNMNFMVVFFVQCASSQCGKYITLFRYALKCALGKANAQFIRFLDIALAHVQQDVTQNAVCLQALQALCENLKPSHPLLDAWLEQNFAAFNSFAQEACARTADPDLIREYSKALQKISEYNARILVGARHLFVATMQTVLALLVRVRELDMQREILLLLMSLSQNDVVKNSQEFSQLQPELLQYLLVLLPNIERALIHHIAHVLIFNCANAIVPQQERFVACAAQAFEHAVYATLAAPYKALLAQGIVQISVRSKLRDLKLVLSDLAQVVNRSLGAEDAQHQLQNRLDIDASAPIYV